MRKTQKATTPGQRHHKSLVGRESGQMEVPKHLRYGKKKTGGRNNTGRITSFHRGGGAKRRLRKVEQSVKVEKQRTSPVGTKIPMVGDVLGIQYDPNRTSKLALVLPTDGGKTFYTLASEGREVGSLIERGSGSSIKSGNTLPRKEIPLGTMVFNVERNEGHGGQIARSAGCQAMVVQKEEKYVLIRLPSGERRKVSENCIATIGQAIGVDHRRESLGKAGRRRNKGQRPVVRGVAMNPIDHPHGGRTKGGVPTVTPQARVAKGKPTRSPGKSSVFIVKSRKVIG